MRVESQARAAYWGGRALTIEVERKDKWILRLNYTY